MNENIVTWPVDRLQAVGDGVDALFSSDLDFAEFFRKSVFFEKFTLELSLNQSVAW